MKRNLWLGVVVLWLAAPFAALRYWQVWNRLPAEVATHFTGSGQPNGWMTPQGSLTFIVVALAIIATVATLIVAFLRKAGGAAWAALGFLYMLAGIFIWANEQILSYNLYGQPVHVAPVIGATLLAVVLFVAIYLGTRRGTELAQSPVIAEEVHASRGLMLILLVLPFLLSLAIAFSVPNGAPRVAVSAIAVILLATLIMAGSGFRYRFTQSGLEIRTLGFRLRSIPAADIRQYAPGKWNLVGGYGIRGIGDCRAYVWGNRGVRISTTSGDVFLGHSDPQQLVHDLDLMTHSASHS